MESPFYIGQEVVAISDHPQGLFKKGQDYTVLDLRQGCCEWNLLINWDSANMWATCSKCQTRKTVTKYWHGCSDFAPKQDLSDMSVEDALELVSNKQLQPIQL